MPLEQIRATLENRSLGELQEIERAELRRLNDAGAALGVGSAHESWQVTAVGGEFMLVSRRGRSISDEQRRQIAAVLGVRGESNTGRRFIHRLRRFPQITEGKKRFGK